MQVQHSDSEAFDRLNQASVALLEPLFDAQADARPVELAARLGEAIAHCAQVADSVGLRGLNYLSTLLAPYLQRQAAGTDWSAVRALVEAWIGEVIAFCAGQLPAADSPRLVLALRHWPGLPPIPEQFVSLIAARLRQDAQVVEVLSGGPGAQGAAQPSAPAATVETPQAPAREWPPLEGPVVAQPAPGQAAPQRAAPPEPAPVQSPGVVPQQVQSGQIPSGRVPSQRAPSERVPSEQSAPDRAREPGSRRWPRIAQAVPPVQAALDEFEMLAQAADALALEAEELTETAAGTAAPVDHAIARGTHGTHALETYRESLANLANAAGYVGVETLADALGIACDAIDVWLARAPAVDAQAGSLLAELPRRLAAYLRAPSPGTASDLSAMLARSGWPVALASDAVPAVASALASVTLVDSRRVAAPAGEVSEDDLSLAIPADADARTVDNLLRELPALCAQFSEAVERALRGSGEELARAQRIAHTLKGAANTVGVRGVATLTHQLEDLLELLLRDSARLPEGLAETLAIAADCLGEMTDAVAGIGEPPGNSLEVCRSLDRWIGRMLRATPVEQQPESAVPAPATLEHAAPEHAAPEHAAPSLPAPALAGEASAGGEPVPEAVAAPAQAPMPETEDQSLRIPLRLVDRMLDLAGEASMLLAQAQEQLGQIGETRGAFRLGTERLQELASELERLVDARGGSLSGRRERGEFDALEMDEFDELHTVSRRFAEAGADGRLLDNQLDRQASALTDVTGQLERIQAELRDAVMQARALPAAAIAPRLARAVRQAARMAGRQAALEIRGEETGIDAQLLQSLVDPLTHLLRNAVDHGIEPPEERVALGKPAQGRIELAFERAGRSLRIRCRDDGRGLDARAIRDRAVELGLLAPGIEPGPRDLARAVMHPGFSTRRAATQLSGRGLGLDIVQQAVAAVRGTVALESTPGAGTEILIEVPERLATLAVAVVRTPSHVLALSIRGVEELLPADGAVRDDAGEERFAWREAFLPVAHLDARLGLAPGHFRGELKAQRAVARAPELAGAAASGVAAIVRRDDGQTVALITPEPGQTRSVVVRPLPAWLPRIDAIEGVTVLGDGSVAPVIDLPALLARAPASARLPAEPALEPRALPVCLVVDDSVSVRRSMEAFMRDLGFAVDTAADGVEALALVERRVPELAIVDLEMPRMNGIELAAALRADERTHGIGVIMITSRYSEKHRAMALDAGVDVFMTKPYTEDELAASVRRCLQARTPAG